MSVCYTPKQRSIVQSQTLWPLITRISSFLAFFLFSLSVFRVFIQNIIKFICFTFLSVLSVFFTFLLIWLYEAFLYPKWQKWKKGTHILQMSGPSPHIISRRKTPSQSEIMSRIFTRKNAIHPGTGKRNGFGTSSIFGIRRSGDRNGSGLSLWPTTFQTQPFWDSGHALWK